MIKSTISSNIFIFYLCLMKNGQNFLLVSLRQVNTGGSVVARGAGALVDIDLTSRSGKSGGAETLRTVVDGNTQSSVFTQT